MTTIHGILEPYFATGTEGIVWSVIENGKEGYDALYCLEYGDYVVIRDPADNSVVWRGNIDFDWETNYRPYPMNPQYGAQAIGGMWVNGIQRGIDPDEWFLWFRKGLRAEVVRSEFGKLYPLKSTTLSAYKWTGIGGLFDEGTPGDLIIRFKSGSYYRYKNVDPVTFWAFHDAESKGRFFASRIKDVFETEKLTVPSGE